MVYVMSFILKYTDEGCAHGFHQEGCLILLVSEGEWTWQYKYPRIRWWSLDQVRHHSLSHLLSLLFNWRRSECYKCNWNRDFLYFLFSLDLLQNFKQLSIDKLFYIFAKGQQPTQDGGASAHRFGGGQQADAPKGAQIQGMMCQKWVSWRRILAGYDISRAN